jgi:hypothetical protein
MNLDSLYRRVLEGKRRGISKQVVRDYVDVLVMLPCDVDYYVEGGKICERDHEHK